MSYIEEPTESNPLNVSCVIIFQSEKDVIARQHSAPISTLDLNEYIAIKLSSTIYSQSIGAPSIYSNKFKGPLTINSSVSVWVAGGKEGLRGFDNPLNKNEGEKQIKMLDQMQLPDEIDLIDGEQHNVRVEYEKDILKIYIDQFTEPLLSVPLSISETLS